MSIKASALAFAAPIIASNESVLIKHDIIPPIGIVSSKPSRTRIIKDHLTNPKLHDFGWGVEVYIGTYKGRAMFVAATPMGDSGSYLAFRELYSHGAKAIVRFGSNDYDVKNITAGDSKHVAIVTHADNLIGAMHDAGVPANDIGSTLFASKSLVDLLNREAIAKKLAVHKSVCHNTANYHATNFPHLSGFTNEATKRWTALHENPLYSGLMHTSDMETAALFFAASHQADTHAVTVLQSIIKTGAKHSDDPEVIKQPLADMQQYFLPLIFDALVTFTSE